MFEFFLSPQSYFTLVAIFGIGAAGSLFFQKDDAAARFWGSAIAILGSLYGIVFSVLLLVTGSAVAINVPSTLSLLSYSINVDLLSAFFVFLISLIALPCSLYAFGYTKHYVGKANIGVLNFFYHLFIASMILVVTAHHALFFLIVWELMSLASYFLVVYESNDEENVKAGTLYFIMTHIGTAFIIVAFLLMYRVTGSFDFETIRISLGTAPLLMQILIFACVLIGFGTKAGIIPFHIWLPSAHPAAPSHVSALMSGVMIKTGIYMLVRIFFDFFPLTSQWLGVTVLVLGSISSLLGVLYALAEHDIKKLLAYHSIENIGIILLGMGSSLVFLSAGMKEVAFIGIIACLFHTMNHAIFKALLFLGAGSVIGKTHTRNIEEYGGLIKVMPFTAFFFLIGSMAISALPPFNGFFSEWLTFQSLFAVNQPFFVVTKIVFILAIGALAFTGGLAAACFVKAFGVTFLARPRSEEACHARESSFSQIVSMAFLAVLTLIVGLSAGWLTAFLQRIALSLQQFINSASVPVLSAVPWNVDTNFATLSMPAIAIALVLAFFCIYYVVSIISSHSRIRYGRTWDCGADLTPRMEITATGFSRSLITIFKRFLLPIVMRRTDYYDEVLHYFPKFTEVKLGMKDIYQSTIIKGLYEIIAKISGYVKKIQSGSVNAYISYMFLSLLLLLAALAFFV